MDELKQVEEPPEPPLGDNGNNYEKKTGNNLSYAGHVFLPLWVRRVLQDADGLDRFLLEYHLNFLLYFGLLFYLVLFFV